MSALFNFQSLLTMLLFIICSCAYIRGFWPSLIEPHKKGFLGNLRRAAVIGDILSIYVSISCIIMSIALLFRA